MALGTRLVHHLFFSQFFLPFKFINGSGLLREKAMTDHTISDNFLMALMGERNRTAGTAIEQDFFGSLILSIDCRSRTKNQSKKRNVRLNGLIERILKSIHGYASNSDIWSPVNIFQKELLPFNAKGIFIIKLSFHGFPPNPTPMTKLIRGIPY